jgi:hypothetical protein
MSHNTNPQLAAELAYAGLVADDGSHPAWQRSCCDAARTEGAARFVATVKDPTRDHRSIWGVCAAPVHAPAIAASAVLHAVQNAVYWAEREARV